MGREHWVQWVVSDVAARTTDMQSLDVKKLSPDHANEIQLLSRKNIPNVKGQRSGINLR